MLYNNVCFHCQLFVNYCLFGNFRNIDLKKINIIWIFFRTLFKDYIKSVSNTRSVLSLRGSIISFGTFLLNDLFYVLSRKTHMNICVGNFRIISYLMLSIINDIFIDHTRNSTIQNGRLYLRYPTGALWCEY